MKTRAPRSVALAAFVGALGLVTIGIVTAFLFLAQPGIRYPADLGVTLITIGASILAFNVMVRRIDSGDLRDMDALHPGVERRLSKSKRKTFVSGLVFLTLGSLFVVWAILVRPG